MNWKELSKEQQQRYILIGLSALVAIFVVVQFVIKPFLTKQAQAKEEYATLKSQLEAAQQAIHNEGQLIKNVEEKNADLKKAFENYIPNPENPLSWATKQIYVDARAVGVDIESVTEVDVDASPWTAKEQAKRVFKPYGVRIAMQCSYFEMIRLLQTLEESNPYLSIAEVSIASQPTDPEKHQASLLIEWPHWKDPEQSKKLTKKFGDDRA